MLAQNSDKQQFSINVRDQRLQYKNINKSEKTTTFTSAVGTITNQIDNESLKRKIDSITQYQKPCTNNANHFCKIIIKNRS